MVTSCIKNTIKNRKTDLWYIPFVVESVYEILPLELANKYSMLPINWERLFS